jgi:esterase/lipase superfamily enzyme
MVYKLVMNKFSVNRPLLFNKLCSFSGQYGAIFFIDNIY